MTMKRKLMAGLLVVMLGGTLAAQLVGCMFMEKCYDYSKGKWQGE